MPHRPVDDLDSIQLASMLSLGLDGDDTEPAETGRAEALAALLDAICIPMTGADGASGALVLPARHAGRFPNSRRLGDALDELATPIEVLDAIKTFAKRRARAAECSAAEAATAVYLAAIAAALVGRGRWISSRSRTDMREHFEMFAAASWCPDSLRERFRRAAECARES